MDSADLLSVGFLILGSILLYFGADSLVKGSSRLAFKLGITPIIIGLTVVAFGTSAPELLVSLSAGMQGKSDIALGNVIGSNICNIALILGLSALIKPIDFNYKSVSKDLWIMVIASLSVVLMSLDGALGIFDGALLTLGIIAYILYNIKKSRNEKADFDIEKISGPTKLKDKSIYHILLLITGLAVLMMGANLFLEGAVRIAQLFGMSDAVIGLSIVALGTSLPELATSAVASMKGESDISLGNVVGSNIFNLLLILGLTALLYPIGAKDIRIIDISVMLAVSVLIVPLGLRKNQFGRLEGAFLLLIYVSYMAYLFNQAPRV